MGQHDDKLNVDSPLYLASTTIGCWKCGASMSVVALIAPKVEGFDGEICMLSNIEELPDRIRDFIQKSHPLFQRQFSITAKSTYFANICPDCGAITGDFFLHSEPGGAFFPETESEAEDIKLTEIPLQNRIVVKTAWGIGSGDMILAHARKTTNPS